MKKVIIILSVVAVMAGGCGQTFRKQQEQKVKMLAEFYTRYFTKMDGREWDLETAAPIFSKYITEDFLQKMERNHLIKDPFCDPDEQGYSKAWIKTIKIENTLQDDDYYSITYGGDDNRRQVFLFVTKNEKGKYLIGGNLWLARYCEKEEVIDDEDDNDNNNGYSNHFVSEYVPDYLPENHVALDAALLALTARKDMAVEYDSLRHAIAFASEVMDLSLFPILPNGYFVGMDFEDYDRDNAQYVKWGTGMKPFRRLFEYANSSREREMAGLDKLIRRFGTLVKLIIPYEKYVANGWEQITHQLLTAYDDLSSDERNFAKVYQIMCEDHNWNYPDFYYEKLAPFVRDKQMEVFISNRHLEKDTYLKVNRGDVNRWSVVWAYSFWARRHHENPDNIPHIVAALKYLCDELYTPNIKLPMVDKNLPPMEPFLVSDIRPHEALYPWKRYTDRVKFTGHGGNEYEHDYIVVEKNGAQHLLLNRFEDYVILNVGDVIDLTWEMEILYEYDDESGNEKMIFREWAHSIRLVEAGVITRFEQKYGGIPKIGYEFENEEGIDEEIWSKICDKVLGYLLESKNPKIREALKIFGKTPEKLWITITNDCVEWHQSSKKPALYGYAIYLSLEHDGVDTYDHIMRFIYNPNTDTLHIDVEAARG
jgi:hypothetical protein